VVVGSAAAPLKADECLVAVRYGRHGALVSVDPHPTHDAHGQMTIAATLIAVRAS